MKRWIFLLLALAAPCDAGAQGVRPIRPPAFVGGIPGAAQMQAIVLQRHQARTLLYRQALDELRKNLRAADVPDCPLSGGGGGSRASLCLAPASGTAAPTDSRPPRGVSPPARRQLAVLIGNNDYASPIPSLNTPISDVTQIAEVLRFKFGYEVTILTNATKGQIVAALNRVAAEATPDDSVLLFYAGHGYEMDEIRMGYWIPVDGSEKTAVNWISNNDIAKLLSAIKARQLLLMSDSCFSGTLTMEQKVTRETALNPEEILLRRSVLVLSSGDEEPVSDEGKDNHSIFAWNLIQTLRESRKITPGFQIYRTVRGAVVKSYPQEPQYGAVLTAGHTTGGEYLFYSKE